MSDISSHPLFSVVIPTYNRAAKVVRAVESVLAQNFADYDVWVIDDGSTDATPEALAPYLDHIHYVRQANGGAARARNRGIQESQGKYVAILDSDDRWYPQKLGACVRAIQAHPASGLFYSQWEVVDEAGRRLWIDRSRKVKGSAYQALLKGDFLAASSAVIKRECLEATGGFDPLMQPCEDWDLWLRIARKFSIELVPEVLVIFEHVAQNTATSNTTAWLAAHDRVIEKALAADPSLPGEVCQAVGANLAYVKGRVCLQAGREADARSYFKQAASLQPSLLKARWYFWVLSSPRLRSSLPPALRRRMRLKEEVEHIH